MAKEPTKKTPPAKAASAPADLAPAPTPAPAASNAPSQAPAPASPPVVDMAELAKDAQALLEATAEAAKDVFTPPPPPLTPAQLAEQERQQYAVQFMAGVKLAQDGVPADNSMSGPTLAGYCVVDPATKLRKDGPTLAQYVAAGYDPANYPPQGYLPVSEDPHHVVVQVEVPKNSFRSGGGASQFRAGKPGAEDRPVNPGTPTTVRHTATAAPEPNE